MGEKKELRNQLEYLREAYIDKCLENAVLRGAMSTARRELSSLQDTIEFANANIAPIKEALQNDQRFDEYLSDAVIRVLRERNDAFTLINELSFNVCVDGESHKLTAENGRFKLTPCFYTEFPQPTKEALITFDELYAKYYK